MRVVQVKPAQPIRKRKHGRQVMLWLVFLVSLGGVINFTRPLPSPKFVSNLPLLPPTSTPELTMPSYGQSALASEGNGVFATQGPQVPLATASIAKVITALCVLQKYPLNTGQTGPTLTISDADVAIYNSYVAQNGSLLEVVPGEKLTEYQALQAILLPSANNIADSLALWAFGSQAAYAVYANQYVRANQLLQTHIGADASGFDPSTTSTAADLAKLGLLAARTPVLAEIAAQKSAYFPVVGTLYNYNTVLGENGISGLKTGNNDLDPGAFLFTASVPVGSAIVAVSGTVMNAPNLDTALRSAVQLVGSAPRAFGQTTILRTKQPIGQVQTAWGTTTPVVATKRVQLTHLISTPIKLKQDIHIPKSGSTTAVGTLEYVAGPNKTSAPVELAQPLGQPSFWWRLTRH